MLNIVVPMAGRGSRFANAGFTLPKPLVPVHDVPMIELVIANVRPKVPHKFVFLCLKDHLDRFALDAALRRWAPSSEVVEVDGITEGAACTVLLARHLVDNDAPLMIVNSDQFIEADISAYLDRMEEGRFDGLIMTMWADDPKWSFVRLDQGGRVVEVVEKKVVSNEATVGIYNFRHGRDFVRSANRMIETGKRVNGEFYVAPVYNELIAEGRSVGYYNVGRVGQGMHGLGTPEDLRLFEQLTLSRQTGEAR